MGGYEDGTERAMDAAEDWANEEIRDNPLGIGQEYDCGWVDSSWPKYLVTVRAGRDKKFTVLALPVHQPLKELIRFRTLARAVSFGEAVVSEQPALHELLAQIVDAFEAERRD